MKYIFEPVIVILLMVLVVSVWGLKIVFAKAPATMSDDELQALYDRVINKKVTWGWYSACYACWVLVGAGYYAFGYFYNPVVYHAVWLCVAFIAFHYGWRVATIQYATNQRKR